MKFCCSAGPLVACASALSDSPAQMRRAASPTRMPPAENIGLLASAPPEGLMVTSSARPASRHSTSSWWLKGACSSAVSTPPRSSASAQRRADAEPVRSRDIVISSTYVDRPVSHAGRSQTSRARSPAASTIAAAPSVTGAQSCLRSGSAYIGRASSSSTDEPPLRTAQSFFSASVSERFTTSAMARSSHRPASMPARACRPANDTVSGHSGVIVYGSSCSDSVRRSTPAEDLPKA